MSPTQVDIFRPGGSHLGGYLPPRWMSTTYLDVSHPPGYLPPTWMSLTRIPPCLPQFANPMFSFAGSLPASLLGSLVRLLKGSSQGSLTGLLKRLLLGFLKGIRKGSLMGFSLPPVEGGSKGLFNG